MGKSGTRQGERLLVLAGRRWRQQLREAWQQLTQHRTGDSLIPRIPSIGTRVAILLALLLASLWVLFTINRVPTAPAALVPAPDSIIFTSPGYVVSVANDGRVHVRFPFNEQGIPREHIIERWPDYPSEPFWEHDASPASVEPLFALVASRSVTGMRREYLAASADATRDDEVAYTVATYGGGEVLKQVTFDDARRSDWPPALDALVGAVTRIAPPPGRQLPRNPRME